MTEISRIQPADLVDVRSFGFSHVVVATGGRRIYVSGQVACDEAGRTVGVGDVEAQTHQVMKNLAVALGAASATFSDVVKLTVFVVNYNPQDRGRILAVRNEYVDVNALPASTLIGVQALASPEYLIEIEAIAEV